MTSAPLSATALSDSFAAAWAAAPHDLDARANFAYALHLDGRHGEAETHFEAVLAARPTHPQALSNYCRMLEHGTNGLMRSEVLCRRALAADPGHGIARLCLAKACLIGLRASEGLQLLEELLRPPLGNGLIQREQLVTYLFHLGYSDAFPPERLRQALAGGGRWLRSHFGPPDALPAAAPRQGATSSRKKGTTRQRLPLKVGILSADAYHHPVGQLLAAFLPEIDPALAEVTFYDVSPKSDSVTELIKGCTRYIAAQLDSADALVQRIRGDGTKVLLETASLTHPLILAAMARRCAPVQLSWGGWVHSHPLDTIDGFIADCHTVPDDAAAGLFLQKVLRLPECVYAYRPLAERPAPAPLPALSNGYVTFGCHNDLAKVNASTLDLWSAVLHAVPDSRLAIKAAAVADQATRDRLAGELASRGITSERLLMNLPSAYADYLADFGRVDIMLDCVPFNGGMTTIDGLWQGVPLLALAGPSHASRVGLSLMHAAGLPEWVAETADDYVALAIRMAADLPALAELRMGLPARLAAKPLGDVKGFAAAMTTLWAQAAA